MSYGNENHISGVFIFHKFVFNDISVIKLTTLTIQLQCLTFGFFFFFGNKAQPHILTFQLFFETKSNSKIEWWVPNGWGWGNLGILSDKWWVAKIEWRVMSYDKKKKKSKQPLSFFIFNMPRETFSTNWLGAKWFLIKKAPIS